MARESFNTPNILLNVSCIYILNIGSYTEQLLNTTTLPVSVESKKFLSLPVTEIEIRPNARS